MEENNLDPALYQNDDEDLTLILKNLRVVWNEKLSRMIIKKSLAKTDVLAFGDLPNSPPLRTGRYEMSYSVAKMRDTLTDLVRLENDVARYAERRRLLIDSHVWSQKMAKLTVHQNMIWTELNAEAPEFHPVVGPAPAAAPAHVPAAVPLAHVPAAAPAHVPAAVPPAHVPAAAPAHVLAPPEVRAGDKGEKEAAQDVRQEVKEGKEAIPVEVKNGEEALKDDKGSIDTGVTLAFTNAKVHKETAINARKHQAAAAPANVPAAAPAHVLAHINPPVPIGPVGDKEEKEAGLDVLVEVKKGKEGAQDVLFEVKKGKEGAQDVLFEVKKGKEAAKDDKGSTSIGVTPVFTKVQDLRPGQSGLTLNVKVHRDMKMIKEGFGQCFVGDETAMIVFNARNHQVNLMATPGTTLVLHNAKVELFNGAMRLAVDQSGHVEVIEPAPFTVKDNSNMSLLEFYLLEE